MQEYSFTAWASPIFSTELPCHFYVNLALFDWQKVDWFGHDDRLSKPEGGDYNFVYIGFFSNDFDPYFKGQMGKMEKSNVISFVNLINP